MKVVKHNRYYVNSVGILDDGVVLTYMKKEIRYTAKVSIDELSEDDLKILTEQQEAPDSYRLYVLFTYTPATPKTVEKYEFQNFELEERVTVFEKPQIINLKDFKPTPIQYVFYPSTQQFEQHIQRDGIFVVAGMTGTGKTYFALKQILDQELQFDHILYLNFELTTNDIFSRLSIMSKGKLSPRLLSKIDIWESRSIKDLKMYMKDKKRVLIVIDNVDYLVGTNPDDMFSYQLSYMKAVATMLKGTDNHCIALTQIIKDVSLEMFDANGEFKFINSTIVSGVKQITDIARSVLVVGKNQNGVYKNKLLKVGSATHAPGVLR